MFRLKILVMGLLATSVFASAALAQQEETRNEIGVQGMGFITRDSDDNGLQQHTTDSGGFLVNYRFNMARWLAAEGGYGYSRNTWQNFTITSASNIQADTHQATGALVLKVPRSFLGMTPYALAGGGALMFDPTGKAGGVVVGADQQTRAAFVYGGGADINLSRHFALRAEYRGLVYKRPDFGLTALDSNATAHTAIPSAGFVIRF